MKKINNRKKIDSDNNSGIKLIVSVNHGGNDDNNR